MHCHFSSTLTQVMDELANINALYIEAKEEVSKADQAELAELREMKSDIERKEKQQASIIENQASRVEGCTSEAGRRGRQERKVGT